MEKDLEIATKTDLKSLTTDELKEFTDELGLMGYRADQLYQWLYQKGASSFDEMTNLSKDLRAKLSDIAEVRRIKIHSQQQSRDGTIKFCLHWMVLRSIKLKLFYPRFLPRWSCKSAHCLCLIPGRVHVWLFVLCHRQNGVFPKSHPRRNCGPGADHQ